MYVHTYPHFMYVCIHTCICMHISIHEFRHVDVFIHIYFCYRCLVPTLTYANACLLKYIYTIMHIHAHVCVHPCM